MRTLRGGALAICALAVACGGGGSGGGSAQPFGDGGGTPPPQQPPPQQPPPPPVSKGGFTFYGAEQQLPPDIWDVSADEAGNVYVAAGDAVLAKKRGEGTFHRYDAASAGLTLNCDEKKTTPCPIVSVAGGAPGVAIIGLKGVGTDGDFDPLWQLDSGGADVLSFDGLKLSRTRHVHIAGVPHQLCFDHAAPPCFDGDATWEGGRRKVRQVLRLAVNHDSSKVQYGDVWMAGSHGTFSLLVANPDRRGWVDLTLQYPGTDERRYVWEHDHPAIDAWVGTGADKRFAYLSGNSTAIAIDPTTGDPWGANETRLASKRGYGARPDGWDVPLWPPWVPEEIPSFLDVWPDPRPANPMDFDALDPRWMDMISSLSFCDDGTLWMASLLHGLARRGTDGTISYLALPDGLGNNASAVACDPSDGSIWVGFGWGGFGRWNGSWWTVTSIAPPSFAAQSPVRNIQIDRWTTPRIVYIAQAASQFGPGGVTVYQGP